MKPRKIENILKKYSESSKIRAGVNVIPYIGGALDILLTSGVQKRTEDRLKFFFNEIGNQIKSINENKLDLDYLESEEFYDLFTQALNLAVKTRLKVKIKIYAEILTSSLISGSSYSIKAEDILNVVEGLTENDIILIRLISEYHEMEIVQKVNSDKVFSSRSLKKISENYSEEFVVVGLLRMLKSSLIIKNHVQNATLADQKFQITPLFEITKDFICE